MAKSKRSVVPTSRVSVALGSQVVREAQRQSLLVSSRASERDTIEFIEDIADERGWRNRAVKRR